MFGKEWGLDQEPPPAEARRVLPDGLAQRAPGPELGTALAALDREELNGHELVVVLRALSRQIAHLQADLYTYMWDLAHTPPGDESAPPDRLELVDEFAADEIAAALRLTPRSADNQLALAFDLARLPQVRRALRQGRIDLVRARVFCQETAHLEAQEAREVARLPARSRREPAPPPIGWAAAASLHGEAA